MNKPVQVLLVEDHVIFREVLAKFFASSHEFSLHYSVGTSFEAEHCLMHCKVDLVLLDLNLQGETALPKIKLWKERFPHVKILVLSGAGNPAIIREAMQSGASGFVSKLDSTAELLGALRKAVAGTPVVSKKIQGLAGSNASGLSRRETEILRFLSAGKLVREMAEVLAISPKTVERHKENIKIKLNLDNAAALFREAVRIFPAEEG